MDLTEILGPVEILERGGRTLFRVNGKFKPVGPWGPFVDEQTKKEKELLAFLKEQEVETEGPHHERMKLLQDVLAGVDERGLTSTLNSWKAWIQEAQDEVEE